MTRFERGRVKARIVRIFQAGWDRLAEAVDAGDLDQVAELTEALLILEEILEELER